MLLVLLSILILILHVTNQLNLAFLIVVPYHDYHGFINVPFQLSQVL